MAAENPAKTTKAAVERRGKAEFVDAIVNAYVYELLLYGGTPTQVVEGINHILRTLKPEWATDPETNELYVIKEDGYSRFKLGLWDLHPPGSYASLAHNAVENVFDDKTQSLALVHQYTDILFQEINEYGQGGEATKGQLDQNTATFFRWPSDDISQASYAGVDSSTKLQPFDIQLFLQWYTGNGIASQGAGPAGSNDVSDGFLNLKPSPQWYIDVQRPNTTGGKERFFRYVPIMRPTERHGWEIDPSPASGMREYL